MPTSLEPTSFGAILQVSAAGATVLLLLAAAVEDGWRYRISNLLVVGVAVCFAAYAAAAGSWPLLGWSLAAGACMLAVASVPFAFGVFGGGDTKLIAVMGLWTQFAALPRFLLVMSAIGGLLGLVWMVRRRLGTGEAPATRQEPSDATAAAEAPAARPFSHLPYGIAIALAGVDFFLFAPNSPLQAWLPF